MFLIDSNSEYYNYSKLASTSSTLTTINNGLLARNSTLDEKKLINSISILKNIIERISKGPPTDTQITRNNYESADSFQKIFALAKESVTLSFKDYLLIHKTTTSKQTGLTTMANNLNPGLSYPSVSSNLSISSSYLASKKPIYSTLINAKSFLNDYMQYYFNTTRSSSIISKYSTNSKTNSHNYGDLFKLLFDNTNKNLNSSLSFLNPIGSNNNNNTLYYMSKLNSTLSNSNNLYDFFNGYKSSVGDLGYTTKSIENSFIPFNKDYSTNQSTTSSLLIGIAFFYSFLIFTSMISNPLLIYVLLWRRKAQIKLIDIYVANLSLSDLFLTIFNIPLCLIIYFSEQWPFGSLLCQLGTFSTSCSIYVNIFTMAFISIDRYFAVTRPLISNPNCQLRKKSTSMDNTTRRKIYMVLTVIWIVALILSLPQFLFSKVSSRFMTNEKEFSIKNKLLNNKVKKSFYKFTQSYFNITPTATTNIPNPSTTNILDIYNNDDYSDSTLEEMESFGNLELLDRVDFGEDPFKKCILEYPFKDMKNYMVLVNFSLQYLIPSIVILYFYGKIIYHLYLNLNVEDLMEMPANSRQHVKEIRKAKSSLEIDKVNQPKNHHQNTSSFLTYKVKMQKSSIAASTLAMNSISDQVRQGGLNRTRNLKKSIKVMIIIIALFLLSWLPIQLYRLITTFYPMIAKLVTELLSSSHFLNYSQNNSTKLFNATSVNEMCKRNLTSNELKDCLNLALKELNSDDSKSISLNFKPNTLHNRYVFFFSYCMAMSSVCYNPIVYFWMHKKFRAEVNQLFSRIFSFFSFKSRKANQKNTDRSEANNRGGYTTTRNQSILPSQTNNNKSNNIYFNKRYSACLANNNNRHSNEINKFVNINKNNLNSKLSVSSQIEPLNPEEYIDIASKKKRSKNSGILNSFKFRSKRFSSLSSESTASSSKKSIKL